MKFRILYIANIIPPLEAIAAQRLLISSSKKQLTSNFTAASFILSSSANFSNLNLSIASIAVSLFKSVNEILDVQSFTGFGCKKNEKTYVVSAVSNSVRTIIKSIKCIMTGIDRNDAR